MASVPAPSAGPHHPAWNMASAEAPLMLSGATLAAWFRVADADGDGIVSPNEVLICFYFPAARPSLGLPRENRLGCAPQLDEQQQQ